MDLPDYSGAKSALLFEDKILILKRDSHLDIPYPGYWDLIGGKREENEFPFDCLKREVEEEINLTLNDDHEIEFYRIYDSNSQPGKKTHFFVIRLKEADLDDIKLGDEGEELCFVEIADYLNKDMVIESYRSRLKDYLLSKEII